MIAQESIDRIYQTARIEEVVGEFVNLKKRGTNLLGLCPFHLEKTPSFNVSPVKGIYKCFGCGKHGDVAGFIMEHEKASYPEALRFLAAKYNLEIDEGKLDPAQTQVRDDRESILILNKWAVSFFSKTLHSENHAHEGLAYLRERGLSDSAITRFDLGYASEEYASLTLSAIKEGYTLLYLALSGLSIKPEQGELYDRFRGRVMFPIHNLTGKITGFGGRILKKNEKTAKYINSPESPVYHKSESLYGIFQAKKAIAEANLCYLAEGYLDVISLSQAGIENVVSSSGTSLTTEQVRLISRFTRNVTILYDGDSAGIKASLRGIDLILEEGMNVRVVLFPEGHDPDSYLKLVGSTAFAYYLSANQKDFIVFKTEVLLGAAAGDPIKKSAVIHDILESIAVVPDTVVSSLYIKQCSALFEIDEQTLLFEANKVRLKRSAASNRRSEVGRLDSVHPAAIDTKNTVSKATYAEAVMVPEQAADVLLQDYPDDIQEREILRLLVNYGSHMLETDETVAEFIFTQTEDIEFNNPLYSKFYQLFYESHLKNPGVLSIGFSDLKERDERQLLSDLLSAPYSLSQNWTGMHHIKVKQEEELLLIAADTAINHLKMRKVMWMIAENQRKMRNAMDVIRQMELQSIHMRLTQLKGDLSQALGVVVMR